VLGALAVAVFVRSPEAVPGVAAVAMGR
jgi:hypothetical protein